VAASIRRAPSSPAGGGTSLFSDNVVVVGKGEPPGSQLEKMKLNTRVSVTAADVAG